MDKKFLKSEMVRIQNNYGKDKFNASQEIFDLWYDVVGDSQEDAFHDAVNECLKKNVYAPNIAGVMTYYDAILKNRKRVKASMDLDMYGTLSEWAQKKNEAIVNAWTNYCKRESADEMIEASRKLSHEANDFRIVCILKGEELPPLEKFIEGKYGC